MRIIHEKKEYELDIKKSLELGVLKRVANPKPGEVWRMEGEDLLILEKNNYHCIDQLEMGFNFPPTPLSETWFASATFIAPSLKEYYKQKLINP